MITDKTDKFIAKLKQIERHKNSKIDRINYVNSITKVEIGCENNHDYYFAAPAELLRGKACPKCAGKNKTTEEFILELKQQPKHINSKTDRINYIGAKIKVEIGCSNKSHEYYFATPSSLLGGSGCPKCAIRNKTTEEFILKLKQQPKHINTKTDRVNYIKSNKKVEIGCSNESHGYYFATPSSLLNDSGCPKCSKNKIKTTEEFISELKQITKHINSKTDRINYIGAKIKVEIGCSNESHGYYFATPSSLLTGTGCPKCTGNNIKTTEEFILALRQQSRHIDSKTDRINYVRTNTKVEIGCSIDSHGYYFMRPNDLLRNIGCPKCSGRNKTTEEFILELKQIHKHENTKTDRINYIGAKTKVEIGCQIESHGYYLTTPNNLLQGVCCPKCSISGYDSSKPGILYYIKINKGVHVAYKIGITNLTIKKRFIGEMKYITVLREIHFQNGEHALNEENRIKEQFKEHRWTGPQLLRSGHTEMFNIDILCLDNSK